MEPFIHHKNNNSTIIYGSFTVRTSKIPGAGKGLFADGFLKKGSVLGRYEGTLHRGDFSDNPYSFETDDGIIILPSEECIFRYINDLVHLEASKRAGELRYHQGRYNVDWEEKFGHVFIITKCDIHPGDELYIDYGEDYWLYRLK